MKVLVLHNAYKHRGGEDAVVAQEVSLLRAGGHSVHVEIIDNSGLASIGAKLRTAARVARDPARISWTQDLIARSGADIVHIHNFFPRLTLAVHEAAAGTEAAVVQTLHNYRLLCSNAQFLRADRVCEKCLTGSTLNAVRHRCYRGSAVGSLALVKMQHAARRGGMIATHVDRFIALTNFARDKFIAGGLPASRLVVKPNFVEASPLPQEAATRAGALFVGRLSREKGVHILLKAWRGLPDIPLTVLGDGPEAAALRAAAPANVRFAGAVPAATVRAAMLSARALIMPSLWYEGFPMTIVEAFAAGLPVIASRLGSMAEIVTDNREGAHFSPGDAQDLQRIVRRAFDAPRFLEGCGTHARARFEEAYSPTVNLAQLEGIYETALASARAR